jgi:cytoskeletal protein CcmA (bactofilin family)
MADKRRDVGEDIKAFLGRGAEFNGKLVLNGSVRIDGEFRGEAMGSGTLFIGEGAYAEADIAVDSIVISGEVRGNLDIKKKNGDFHQRGGWGGTSRRRSSWCGRER